MLIEVALATFMAWWLILSLLPFYTRAIVSSFAIPSLAYGILSLPPSLSKVVLALACGAVVLLIGKLGVLFSLGAPEPWSWQVARAMLPRPVLHRPSRATGRRFIPGEQPDRKKIPDL
jgi:hypothetical protein